MIRIVENRIAVADVWSYTACGFPALVVDLFVADVVPFIFSESDAKS